MKDIVVRTEEYPDVSSHLHSTCDSYPVTMTCRNILHIEFNKQERDWAEI